MNRRTFIVVLTGGFVSKPTMVSAQQRKVPLVAILSPAADPPGPELPENIAALVRGLKSKGYEDGKNIRFQFRFAGWRFDQLSRLAAELVSLKPDVIFTHTTNGVLAAKAATRDIPIVIGAAGDLVNRGVIESLSRPGGNVTGLTLLGTELDAKRVELMKQAVPGLQRMAILANPKNPVWRNRPTDLLPLVGHLGITFIRVDAASTAQIESAFPTIAAEKAGAVLVESDALFTEPSNRELIMNSAKRLRLPTISDNRLFADAGGLIAYGVSFPAMFEYAATYVDKILKGAKPADLPVEQPTKFELIINLKTAKALGLQIPTSFLLRADEVIE